MRPHLTAPLFDWSALEDSPSLQTVRCLLDLFPDDALLEALRQARGRGRNDYPVHVLWGVVLLTALLRHPTTEACLGELRRNRDLRELIGIESEDKVPKPWNVSRFEELLGSGPHPALVREMFGALVERLGQAVPDLGARTAGDATALKARTAATPAARTRDEAAGLPAPAKGRKEYKDDEGKVVKVVEWFGYKLHLLVDVVHEVVLAYWITDTKAGDGETLPHLVEEAQARLPEGRMKNLAYDKAADSEAVHEMLHQADIVPLIENRRLWKEEGERPLPGLEGQVTNLVHDEAGAVYCYDTESPEPVRHAMAYIGHEKSRGTLKYRCPARHQGWSCPSEAVCNQGLAYGKTVRIKQELDLRRFPAIPRATQQFERLYKGRTAVERVNARLKVFWGADDGNMRGARRFHARVGAVLLVHLGLATLLASAPRTGGVLGKLHLGAVQRALRAASS